MRADLHIHSNYSDGIYSNEEVVEIAKRNQVDLICITNHDTLEGLNEIAELTKKKQIKNIYGVELSTFRNNESVHILGFFINNDWYQEDLIDFFQGLKKRRQDRCLEIIEKLKELHQIEIDPSKLFEKNTVITRGHISKLVADKLNITKNEVFEKYLAEGRDCFIPSGNLSTKDGIDLLHRNNCICVLAHPCLLKKNKVEDIINLGIDGLEAVYPYNTLEQTKYYKLLVQKYNLIETAGSDFHGTIDKKHNTIGYCSMNSDLIKKLEKKLNLKLV